MAATQARGVDLLDEAIANIERNPDSWIQTVWRCRTGCCLAGHIAELAGGQWAAPVGHPLDDRMIAVPGDPEEYVTPAGDGQSEPVIQVADRAQALIGFANLSEIGGPTNDLFHPDNTLGGLKRMAAEARRLLAKQARGDQ